jgi:tagatose 6-phosphate kinase
MSKVLAVALHPSFDSELVVRHFNLESEMRVETVRVSPGGKAVNCARALKALGVKVELCGIWGRQDGARAQALLVEEGLTVHSFFVPGETRTCWSVRDIALNKHFRLIGRGPQTSLSVLGRLLNYISRSAKTANVMIFSGSLPPGVPDDYYAGLVSRARDKNVLSVLDTSGQALAEGLKARPFLVKPNRQEAEALLGYRLSSARRIRRALTDISGYGASVVLLSLGEDGIVVFDGVRAFTARSPRLRGVRSAGCGDAALAGFLAGFLAGEALPDCLGLACACGAANTAVPVAGAISCEAVNRCRHRVKVERF